MNVTRVGDLGSTCAARVVVALLIVVGCDAPSLAQAQSQAAPASAEPARLEEVVVTGSLIRGIAPVGTHLITLSQDDIAANGAASTQQLLANIPQITSSFNFTPSVDTGVSGQTATRPNIRNLVTGNGGNTTLVLLDGHNMVGAGILLTTPDIGVIPPSVLKRVDVLPDGGSSLYGSDAIGGIVNLITRTDIEGIEAAGHYGVADNFDSTEVSLTGGRSWESGSALLAYSYRKNSNIYGADRDYFRTDRRRFGGTDARVIACEPGNITADGVSYAMPAIIPGTLNRCDQDEVRDVFPREDQHSAFARLRQSVTENIEFQATAYYAYRTTNRLIAQNSSSNLLITNANPYFQPIGSETQQTVSYNYSTVFGPSLNSRTTIDEFGVTPQLTFSLGGDWQVTALTNFGRSITKANSPEINNAAEATALAATTTATALNPYDVAATNPAILAGIQNFAQQAQSTQKLYEGRVIVDGPLLHLPGGEMRAALGAQYQKQKSSAFQTDAPLGDFSNAARAQTARQVTAAFGQFVVPILGVDNARAGISALTLDVSLRYDHYSDFGGTTNPKFGISYSPLAGLTFRGNYGTSFNAPSLADTTGAVDTRVGVVPVSPWQPVFSAEDFLRPTLLLVGGNPAGLKPQSAHTYSFGVDYQPSYISGLSAGLTYWNVAIKDTIQVTPFYSPQIFTDPALARFYLLNPTYEQAKALVGSQTIQGPSLESLYASGPGPYAIFDGHRNNLGKLDVDGIDFGASYTTNTPIGTIVSSLSGSYTLKRESSVGEGVTFDELENGISKLQFTAAVGTRYNQFSARISMNYSLGYSVIGLPSQRRVDSFHPVNLALAYDFEGGLLKNTTATLNVDNIVDEDPPFFDSNDGTANGQTFGRFVNIGLQKKF